MRKALWEVPEQVTGLWIDLLRVQAGVVREQKQLLHQLPGLVPATGGGERREQGARVQLVRPGVARIAPPALGPGLPLDEPLDFPGGGLPACHPVARQLPVRCESAGPLERDPAENGSAGSSSSEPPFSASSTAPNALDESRFGRHSQSIAPSIPTSATVRPSPIAA